MSVVLSEHLPLLASAPDGIQKLRGLILELAVRGKLVPQDPNDEPASELLKRIAQERARLEMEGVCKRTKATPAVNANERLFQAPETWKWCRFSEFAVDVSTGPFGSMLHQSDYVVGGVPLVNPSHMVRGRIIPEAGVAVSESKAAELSSYRLSVGDVVMARRGEVGRTAVVSENEQGWLCGTGSFVIHLVQEVSRPYVVMLFQCPTVRRYLSDEAVGTTMVNLNHGILKAMPVAVPTVAEQHRIVAKVDELMALCDRLEAEQTDAEAAHAKLVDTLLGTLTQSTDAAELAANWQRIAEHFDTLFITEASIDALKQTVLQLAVMGKLVPQDPNDEPASELLKRLPKQPDPPRYAKRSTATIVGTCALSVGHPSLPSPEGWMWTPLVRIARLESGHTPSRNRSDWWDGDVPWIGIADARIHNDRTILETLQTTNEEGLANSAARLLPAGTVCFSRTASVGYVVTMGRPMATSQDFVNWVPTAAISSAYLALAFRAERPAIKRFSKGAVHQTIYYPEWLAMYVLLPPLPEQRRIVAKVDELMALCDRLKADLGESRAGQDRLSVTLIESALQAA